MQHGNHISRGIKRLFHYQCTRLAWIHWCLMSHFSLYWRTIVAPLCFAAWPGRLPSVSFQHASFHGLCQMSKTALPIKQIDILSSVFVHWYLAGSIVRRWWQVIYAIISLWYGLSIHFGVYVKIIRFLCLWLTKKAQYLLVMALFERA